MIQDTITKIESRIEQAGNLNPDRQAELRSLLATLRQEVAEVARTNREAAQSIAGFAQVSTHEAMRTGGNPALLNLSLKGLAASVEGFENTHPRLVQAVNGISSTLANLGI